jgi:hypothetical protein
MFPIGEVEEIKLGVVQKNRSFPFGEGEGEWGLLNREQKVQEGPSIN